MSSCVTCRILETDAYNSRCLPLQIAVLVELKKANCEYSGTPHLRPGPLMIAHSPFTTTFHVTDGKHTACPPSSTTTPLTCSMTESFELLPLMNDCGMIFPIEGRTFYYNSNIWQYEHEIGHIAGKSGCTCTDS